ncbi:3-oxoadipyl-CoA thiolase [Chondrinema litorale]|uniref:3-oxoadipyl-CoA thiolase n=1 Tax=Chondrinema litorale TaxID=2994555 RepID=UPI002543C29A|nr:3-oxoadipyl-CoA thiolase [Chondrinema litorale]UZR96935.1 3-oxoadipyl-CoA thiolase [Chondrinema litorale]
MKESYIIDAVRTPVGKLGGGLSEVRADDLAAIPIKALMDKFPNLPKDAIDDVILGCHNQAGEDNRNVARMALLLAGLPYTVPGETVNRLCSSGMSSVVHANRAIKADEADLIISGGMEHMTRGPLVISKASKPFGNDSKMENSSFGWRFVNPKMEEMYGTDAMGITAENLAEMYKISREDQDLFAYQSQMKAAKAQQNGILQEEIVSVLIPQRKGEPKIINQDEFIRAETTVEILAKLRPVFKKDGTVTAGNASGLNDGAGAMLVASENAVKQYSLNPKVRIVTSAVVGVEPRIMGIGPVGATKKALKRAGLKLSQMDVIELNEAFAAQSLACMRELGIADDDERVNPNGGAIAIGHPLGMSGTRIIQAATNQLFRTNGKYALATMCIGVGMGYAIIIERV